MWCRSEKWKGYQTNKMIFKVTSQVLRKNVNLPKFLQKDRKIQIFLNILNRRLKIKLKRPDHYGGYFFHRVLYGNEKSVWCTSERRVVLKNGHALIQTRTISTESEYNVLISKETRVFSPIFLVKTPYIWQSFFAKANLTECELLIS